MSVNNVLLEFVYMYGISNFQQKFLENWWHTRLEQLCILKANHIFEHIAVKLKILPEVCYFAVSNSK